jgi:hypothetical protein
MFGKIKQIIIGYILWIWYYLYKPYRDKRKKEADKRMKICEECKHFNKSIGNCEICGCIMAVKVKLKFPLDKDGISIGGCVERKW